jgi:hypothetical protein
MERSESITFCLLSKSLDRVGKKTIRELKCDGQYLSQDWKIRPPEYGYVAYI